MAQGLDCPPEYTQDRIMISTIDTGLKPLPLARWKTAMLPAIPPYPGLSQLAGIEGELMMHIRIDPKGKVVDTKLVSGPPQLARCLSEWARAMQFQVQPEDGTGPWHYSISAKFSLPNRIQIFPSAVKLLPTVPKADNPSRPPRVIQPNRWGTSQLHKVGQYPHLAGIARIEGDVITAVSITQTGTVENSRALTGPSQLFESARNGVKQIKFDVGPSDGDGPWVFFVTAHFNLTSKSITFSPTPQDRIPFDQLGWVPK